MVTVELQRAHLQPLTFPLEPLESLSSLQLALVQYHLANDEPGFDSVIRAARETWIRRRTQALQSGQQVDGVVVPPPRPPPVLASQHPPAHAPFIPLIKAIRKASATDDAPRRADVGNKLLGICPSIYNGPYKAFKPYSMAAQTMGIVELIRGNGGPNGGGSDRISLTSQYKNLPLSPPATPAPPLPPRPPPRPNLTPDNFHLASLTFSVSLADLSSLPSHHLLLLQFRADIMSASSSSITLDVERAFWRRRAAALEVGERIEASAAVINAPHLVHPASSHFPAAGPFLLPSVPPSRTTSAHSRPTTSGAALPPLDESLPAFVTNGFHTLEALYLPPQTIPTVPALLTLLSPHLSSTAAILYPPSPTPIPSSSYAPVPPILARRAHFAFRSPSLAAAAQAHLNALRLPSTDGAVFAVQAGSIPAGIAPKWCWGDVRPDERAVLWRACCEAQVVEAKRPREEAAGVDGRLAAEKRPRLVGAEEVVAPSDPVPPHLFAPLFPAALTYKATPRDLNNVAIPDDSFVWRFHAVGWLAQDKGGGICLLFSSPEDREAFRRWIFADAQRYWKFNHVKVRDLSVDEAARLDWRFQDFSPTWRREHGYSLAPSPTGDDTLTVGELGEGPDRPIGAPDHWLVGRFDFEYVQNGQRPPVRAPPDFAARTHRASGGASLAARIGGSVDEPIFAALSGAVPRPRDNDRFAPVSTPPPPAAAAAAAPAVSPRSAAAATLAQRLGAASPAVPVSSPSPTELAQRLAAPPATVAPSAPPPSATPSSALAQHLAPPSASGVARATPILDLTSVSSPPPSPRSPAYPPPAPVPTLDTALPAFASVLGAARLYPAPPPPPRAEGRRARRVTACALWEFEEALERAVEEGLRHVGEEAPPEAEEAMDEDEGDAGEKAMDVDEMRSAHEAQPTRMGKEELQVPPEEEAVAPAAGEGVPMQVDVEPSEAAIAAPAHVDAMAPPAASAPAAHGAVPAPVELASTPPPAAPASPEVHVVPFLDVSPSLASGAARALTVRLVAPDMALPAAREGQPDSAPSSAALEHDGSGSAPSTSSIVETATSRRASPDAALPVKPVLSTSRAAPSEKAPPQARPSSASLPPVAPLSAACGRADASSSAPTSSSAAAAEPELPSARRTLATAPEAVSLAFEKQAPAGTTASGAPLVVLHGLYGSKQNWRSLAKGMAARLARDVFTLDLRNHGTSPHKRECSYEDLAADVRAFIQDEQRLDDCIVVGHSMGGKVAMALALGGCEPLSKLVVVDIAPGVGKVSPEFQAYLDAMKEINEAKVMSRKEADAIMQKVEPDLGVRQFLLTNLDRADPSSPYQFRLPLDFLSNAIGEIGHFPYTPGEKVFDKPSLFLKGKKSKYINSRNIPLIKQFFPSSQLEVLDAGHWVHAERPKEFVELLDRFCKA
ncbi:hypothetical protein JCM10450v2_002096 [Rhodotorula kratochvilovae]